MSSIAYCPLDGTPMTERPHGQGSFHQCWECSGVWVSRLLLHGLSNRRDSTLMGALDTLPEPVHRVTSIHCPDCGYLMAQRIQHGVQLDTCPDCRAVWLDGGEVIHIGRILQKKTRDAAMITGGKDKKSGVLTAGLQGLHDGSENHWLTSGGIFKVAASLIEGLLD